MSCEKILTGFHNGNNFPFRSQAGKIYPRTETVATLLQEYTLDDVVDAVKHEKQLFYEKDNQKWWMKVKPPKKRLVRFRQKKKKKLQIQNAFLKKYFELKFLFKKNQNQGDLYGDYEGREKKMVDLIVLVLNIKYVN